MATPEPTSTDAAPPAGPAPRTSPWRLLLRSLATGTGSLLLSVAVVAAGFAWLLGTTAGMNSLIGLVNRFVPGIQIDTQGAFGELAGEFGFAEVRVKVDRASVHLSGLRARIRDWELRPPRIDFAALEADALRVDVITDELPIEDIGVPLQLTADRVRLDRLMLNVDGTEFSLQSIAGRARAGPSGYRVEDGHVAFGDHRAAFDVELGARRPFALQANAQLRAQVQDKAIDAALRARGSLVDLALDGEVSGAATGTFSAAVASFDRPALHSLSIDLVGIDPRFWHHAAPVADLRLTGTLTPNATMDRVAGRIAVENRAPGRIDAERIPARSATADVELDARGLRFERVAGQLLQGTVSGDFSVAFADGSWTTSAHLVDVDPARLHGALQPLRVDGRIQAQRTPAAISVTAELRNRGQPAASLEFDGRFTSNLATIQRARLDLGDGFATAAGTIELGGASRADLKGSLQRFEPGRLVKGVDARLSGEFLVDGVLKPRPAGRVRFDFDDSRAWGRPLTAKGRIELDPSQRIDVDVDMAVRSARLVAKGGLGAPDRVLDVKLDAPKIDELLPAPSKTPLAGSVVVTGTARGDWTAPELQLQLVATGLRYGEHAVQSIEANGSYAGGRDGALKLAAGLLDYRNATRPKAVLRSATLTANGQLSNHAIRLTATAEQTHAGTVIVDGGWKDDAWHGRIREAVLAPPLDLRLLGPTSLVVSGQGVELGPAQLAIDHVRFDDVRLRTDEAGLSTSGRFSGLQPTRFSVPVEGALAPIMAPTGERTPLTLRGDWDLRLVGDSANGHLLIERSGGDVYAGRGPDSALGLNDMWLDARIEANRLEARTRIEARRGGGLGAHFEAWLENSPDAGWRLAQTRPWLISGAFEVATMEWINALLSDHLRANVRLGGSMSGTVRVQGTPAAPTAAGRLSGSDLRVAWVEQGVRLENGRLLAHLTDDLFVLDQLEFSGPPRVRPEDRRAAAAVPAGRNGSVSATGRIRLSDLTGVIQIAATHLPLLQRPDRWVIASGGGNIETSARHIQLNGAFAADAGFVGLARSDLPSLSNDVIVVRSGEVAETRARRVTLGFDLGLDLGDAFYLSGRGLNTRVEGALRLRSAGRGAITAVGTIEAVDGVYEGFGQKLRIARGRLNFQGAPENPGLDILALRPGLPVEVGVTITRTAAAPLVRMHSDPPMTDPEALSWLVLGRAPDQAGGDNIALVTAAAGLLGGSSEGYGTRVARAVGVDEISIRRGTSGIASLLPARSVAGALRSDESSAATVAGEIITIGKNINESLTVSYQQAISDTSRFLQLNYQLSRHLSAVVRGGTDNAIDLVYSIAFD